MRPDAETWLRSFKPTPEGFEAILVYPPEACEGHFPGYPLVPAVYLIEGVRAAAERAAGRPLRLARVSDAKFSAEVRPGDEVVVPALTCEPTYRMFCRSLTPWFSLRRLPTLITSSRLVAALTMTGFCASLMAFAARRI